MVHKARRDKIVCATEESHLSEAPFVCQGHIQRCAFKFSEVRIRERKALDWDRTSHLAPAQYQSQPAPPQAPWSAPELQLTFLRGEESSLRISPVKAKAPSGANYKRSEAKSPVRHFWRFSRFAPATRRFPKPQRRLTAGRLPFSWIRGPDC